MANNILKDHRRFVNTHYMTRNDVVPYYASLIITNDDNETKRINELILSKWTPSGLLYIKEKAWKTKINGLTLYDAWRDGFKTNEN
jgi:hypothetical protein